MHTVFPSSSFIPHSQRKLYSPPVSEFRIRLLKSLALLVPKSFDIDGFNIQYWHWLSGCELGLSSWVVIGSSWRKEPWTCGFVDYFYKYSLSKRQDAYHLYSLWLWFGLWGCLFFLTHVAWDMIKVIQSCYNASTTCWCFWWFQAEILGHQKWFLVSHNLGNDGSIALYFCASSMGDIEHFQIDAKNFSELYRDL